MIGVRRMEIGYRVAVLHLENCFIVDKMGYGSPTHLLSCYPNWNPGFENFKLSCE